VAASCFNHAHSGINTLELLQGHEDKIQSIAFSPDGERIASGLLDTTIRVWDTVSGVETLSPLRGHKRPVWSVAFLLDGKQIVSGSGNLTVHLWNAESGAHTLPPLWGHRKHIVSVAFSPDGSHIVSGCEEGIIHLWDAASGAQILRPLMGHEDTLISVTFSCDGLLILATRFNQGIQAWDTSGAPIIKSQRYLEHSHSNDTIIVTPDAWIVDIGTHKVIGKFPPMLSVKTFAEFKAAIAFTTKDRESTLFIMHFPPSALTSCGSWDPDEDEMDNDWEGDDDHYGTEEGDGRDVEEEDNDYIDSSMP
jgi:WD40 repeat protein